MENNEEQLTRLEQKIDAIFTSAEKTRKYMLTTVIITVVTIALPIILAAIILPMVMQSLGDIYQV